MCVAHDLALPLGIFWDIINPRKMRAPKSACQDAQGNFPSHERAGQIIAKQGEQPAQKHGRRQAKRASALNTAAGDVGHDQTHPTDDTSQGDQGCGGQVQLPKSAAAVPALGGAQRKRGLFVKGQEVKPPTIDYHHRQPRQHHRQDG